MKVKEGGLEGGRKKAGKGSISESDMHGTSEAVHTGGEDVGKRGGLLQTLHSLPISLYSFP